MWALHKYMKNKWYASVFLWLSEECDVGLALREGHRENQRAPESFQRFVLGTGWGVGRGLDLSVQVSHLGSRCLPSVSVTDSRPDFWRRCACRRQFSSSIPSLRRGLLGTGPLGPSPTWLVTVACSHCFFCKEVTLKLSRNKPRDQRPQ